MHSKLTNVQCTETWVSPRPRAADGEEDQDGRGEPDHLHRPPPSTRGGGGARGWQASLGGAALGVRGGGQGVGRQG